MSAYLEESSTGLKWLTQQLALISAGVGDVLLELADSVMVGLNPTLLRQMNAFNILEEGASMALPVKKSVSRWAVIVTPPPTLTLSLGS